MTNVVLINVLTLEWSSLDVIQLAYVSGALNHMLAKTSSASKFGFKTLRGDCFSVFLHVFHLFLYLCFFLFSSFPCPFLFSLRSFTSCHLIPPFLIPFSCSLYDAHGMNAYRAGRKCLSVLLIQAKNS